MGKTYSFTPRQYANVENGISERWTTMGYCDSNSKWSQIQNNAMIIQSEIDPRLPIHANGNISVEIRHNIDDENSEETNCIAQLVRKDESPAPNLQARELTLPKNSKPQTTPCTASNQSLRIFCPLAA